MDNNKSEEIARLNDDFRHHLSKGTLVLTSGIRCNTKEDIAEIIAHVRNFNNFNEDNDPYGEHDFGAFDFKGKKINFKDTQMGKNILWQNLCFAPFVNKVGCNVHLKKVCFLMI